MKKLLSMLLLLAMLLTLLPAAASAAEDEITPYAYSCAQPLTKPMSMGGYTYNDAIQFTMGYTGISDTGSKGEIAYNFKGMYKSLTFDVGYVKGDDRNATFTVIADGEVVKEAVAVSYTDIPRRHTVDLEGVTQLVIRFNSGGYDKTYYAMGDIVAEPVTEAPANTPLVSTQKFDACRYQLMGGDVKNGVFAMGGYQYENGYILRAGYNAPARYNPLVAFNFKGAYTKMSFDVCRYMSNQHADYLRPAYLTIEADGVALEDYNNRQMLWNDTSLHVELDLTGVSQLLIKLRSDGYDTLYYGIGDIHLEHPHTPTAIPEKAPTCGDTGLTGGKECSICGEVLEKQEIVPATGEHTYTDDKDESCNVCGYIREISTSVPMHRMYDPNSGEHFYTGAELERDFLVEAGWHYEGVGFNFPLTGAPVHRLYEPVHGEHLYTMDKQEMNRLIADGWIYEGVAFNSAGSDEVPQYRLHNPNAKRGGYHFTGSEIERNILIEAGWIDQGIGWYSCLK